MASKIAGDARPTHENHERHLEWLSKSAGRNVVLGFLHLINPLYTASGFAVGMLVGFTGVGGGSLMTPLLVLLFGIHPATAVGTDLLYAGSRKSAGPSSMGSTMRSTGASPAGSRRAAFPRRRSRC